MCSGRLFENLPGAVKRIDGAFGWAVNPAFGGAEGAGVVLIFEGSSKMLIARQNDSLILGVPSNVEPRATGRRPRR